MKKEKKKVHPRWSDTSGLILRPASKEVQKKATEKMVSTIKSNFDKFIEKYESKGKDKK